MKGRNNRGGTPFSVCKSIVNQYHVEVTECRGTEFDKESISIQSNIDLAIEIFRHSLCEALELPSALGVVGYDNIVKSITNKLRRYIYSELRVNPSLSESSKGSLVQVCVSIMLSARDKARGNFYGS